MREAEPGKWTISVRDDSKTSGFTLQQLSNAISNANSNIGGDIQFKEPSAVIVRGVNLFGGGMDPLQSKEVLGAAKAEFDAHLARDQKLPLVPFALAGIALSPELMQADDSSVEPDILIPDLSDAGFDGAGAPILETLARESSHAAGTAPFFHIEVNA